MAVRQKNNRGILAEFKDTNDLLVAAAKVRDAGYKAFDCLSPFPIHGMDEAMGLKRSPLGWMVGIMSLVGAGLALLLQWWTSSVAYPLVISGKPFFSFQAYVPITFGIAVLLGALTSFFGMLALNRLPRLHHPVFYSDSSAKITDDGFFIFIESHDEKYDEKQSGDFLQGIGAVSIEMVRGDA